MGKRVDHRSDIFSLGVVFYEMVTGQRPFRGDGGAAVLAEILRDTPPSVNDVNPLLPSVLGEIIVRCSAKEPDSRYQRVNHVRHASKNPGGISGHRTAASCICGETNRFGRSRSKTAASGSSLIFKNGWDGSKAVSTAPTSTCTFFGGRTSEIYGSWTSSRIRKLEVLAVPNIFPMMSNGCFGMTAVVSISRRAPFVIGDTRGRFNPRGNGEDAHGAGGRSPTLRVHQLMSGSRPETQARYV